MKILLVNKFFQARGGPESFLVKLTKILQKHEHKVIHFAMQHPNNWPSKFCHYFVSNIDYNRNYYSAFQKIKIAAKVIYSLEARRRLEALLRKEDPDLAHLHNIYHQLSPSILHSLKKFGIPTVMTLHDFKLICPNCILFRNGQVCDKCQGHRFYHALLNKCVKDSFSASFVCMVEMYFHRLLKIYQNNVDRFIALSKFMYNKMLEYNLCAKDQITWLPNTIDVNRFTPNYSMGKYVLFVGGISQQKGLMTLVQSMEYLPNVRLRIAGDGDFRRQIQHYIGKKNLGNINFLGFVQPTEIPDLLSNASLLVVPSVWCENNPTVVLEAYAAGKPVIASNIGTLPETVEHEETGLLFEPGNSVDLASKIEMLYKNPELVKRMGKKGRHMVENEYSLEVHYEKLSSLYENVLQYNKPN